MSNLSIHNISEDAQRMFYVLCVSRMETIKDLSSQDGCSIPVNYDKIMANIKACNSNIVG